MLLAGIVAATIGCAERASKPSSDSDDSAYLRVSSLGFAQKLCPLCSHVGAELFAVDQRRVLDRNEVVLKPGEHEVEFALSKFSFGLGVRRLSFEAVSGKSYELGVQDISGDSFGTLSDSRPSYWIKERGTEKVVAAGESRGFGDKSDFDRKWYIDQFHGRIGSIPSNDGDATVVVTAVETLWVTIAGVEGGKGGGYTVPAGETVIEVINRRKQVTYSGRLVVDLRPKTTYYIEAKGPTGFSGTDISKVWITDAETNEKVGQFHSCWAGNNAAGFSDCEVAPGARIEYADIKPGDPRFWWGPSGQEF